MPEISLTDFVDFVIKAGSPKQTKVRELFNRAQYSPAFDYWKQLREHIAHAHGGTEKIGSILEGVDLRKKQRYDAALTGYRKFLKRTEDSAFFVPPCERWTHSGLTVKVNPELGLLIRGQAARHQVLLQGRRAHAASAECGPTTDERFGKKRKVRRRDRRGSRRCEGQADNRYQGGNNRVFHSAGRGGRLLYEHVDSYERESERRRDEGERQVRTLCNGHICDALPNG